MRYADVLVIERKPGLPPRVESFSFKSRDFSGMTDPKPLAAKMKADAAAALRFYGETLDIRRPSLKHLGSEVQVRRVRLVYEGGELKPEAERVLQRRAGQRAKRCTGRGGGGAVKELSHPRLAAGR